MLKIEKALLDEFNIKPKIGFEIEFYVDDPFEAKSADENAFLGGLKSLGAISSIQKMYIGPPGPTEERGVVDNSYSYALIVHFQDVEGHDAYQIDPIHLKFIEDHKDKWTKVVVYDNGMLE